MTSKGWKLVIVAFSSTALALGTMACDEDEVQQAIDEFLATDTPSSQSTPAPTDEQDTEPTADVTSGTELTATEGWCVHGTGESTLYIIFRGVPEGETVSGSIVGSPEGGLTGAPDFEGTAGPEGTVIVTIPIRRFGVYRWEANAGTDGEWASELDVAEVCPPEPPA
jgi:hypothetical protein